MLNFVTLFNSNYLSRGLVLYQSLVKHCPNFHLYVVTFDDATFDYFQKNPQKNLTAISLTQFEDKELLSVKSTRSAAEYCWTSTPSTILYCINNFNLSNCTYLDADMCFYSDPKVLFDEMGDNSVLITDHRYTQKYDQSATSGKYCVQFVTFKNTEDGLLVLNWWRNACIDWCYNRVEDGKFGDQKYLDDWTTQFKGVHELRHLGGGIAPWNVQQYNFSVNNNTITGTEISSNKIFDVVFFHYHGLKFFENDVVLLADTSYDLTENVKITFFNKYVKALCEQNQIVKKTNPKLNANGVSGPSKYMPFSFKTILKYYFENIKSSKKNILGGKLIDRIKHHHYFYLDSFK
ncbi:MAG: glycosyl transferase [Bacteroidota bacterium]|nr:glycosyl transferase [Bacteroidota bacterium]MDP3145217.1 glycosyl transferase [Bacteroidota bacterium]MDP3557258.1 glycosyl transferase [Bacteroidota bacterium]